MQLSNPSIRQLVLEIRRDKSTPMRQREIAELLSISEGELISAFTRNDSKPLEVGDMATVRLCDDWENILRSLHQFGEVMALTRNQSCVHEKIGRYQQLSKVGSIGVFLGEIDLRVLFKAWAFGFAVEEMTTNGLNRSLQFFDQSGTAIHKVYLNKQSDMTQFEAIVLLFKNSNHLPSISVTKILSSKPELPDHQIDVKGFHLGWRNMKDTHDFYYLLKTFSLTRIQGFRLAEREFVTTLPITCSERLLKLIAKAQIPMMAFVGNLGMIQIHTGLISNVFVKDGWLNIMDVRFNLHLLTENIATAWVVRKPTLDGLVTSVEFFDAEGEAILMCFGERKPGRAELLSWRQLVNELLLESSPTTVEV